MPTVIAGRVRMDAKEKDLIEIYAEQPINPQTIDEFNAWVDLAAKGSPSDTPEDRLMKAVIGGLRIDAEAPHDPVKIWRTPQSSPAKVIQFGAR